MDGSELSGKAEQYPSLCHNLSNSISVRGDLFYVVDRRDDWFKFPNFKANNEKRVTLASPLSSCRASSLASMCDLAIFMTGGLSRNYGTLAQLRINDIETDEWSECTRYDIEADEWTVMPSLNFGRHHHSSCSLGLKLYVFFG